jgi:VacB/RNase II family 3'-5' exoribonuclease
MKEVDLKALARREMVEHGFQPDFPESVRAEVRAQAAVRAADLGSASSKGISVQDLRDLPWSSIDNDTSRDLDQIEVAERLTSAVTRIRVGIADVDALVAKGSAIDLHANSEGVTVYTGVETFAMLPEELSTDRTSLLEGADRQCLVIEFDIDGDAAIVSSRAYLALVRNQAQLAYSQVGPWLQGACAPPAAVSGSTVIEGQLRLQDEIAGRLKVARVRMGALNIDSIETAPVFSDGQVSGIRAVKKNRANSFIEDFMIAANEVTARMLSDKQVSSIRRVVKTPERWNRIVELAAGLGEELPSEPDSRALNAFLLKRKSVDPVHAPDLSLAVVKLMGPGEYVVERPGDPKEGHFGLAVQDYTHSTAPNRRYADLVTQRLTKAVIAGRPAPYSDSELESIARTCTLREDAARKVERNMRKRIAAVAVSDRIGQSFRAVVTGVTSKGTFVRTLDPPVDGRVVRGEQGLDVGQQVTVTLLATDPQRGFIDFGC